MKTLQQALPAMPTPRQDRSRSTSLTQPPGSTKGAGSTSLTLSQVAAQGTVTTPALEKSCRGWLGAAGFSVLMTADGDVTEYRVRAQGRALDEAVNTVARAMAPLSIDEIRRGVAMLSARCSVANTADTALRVAALVEALAEMPADLAADVLTNWHRENTWLPTAAEVWKRHGWRVKQRQMLLQALEGAAC